MIEVVIFDLDGVLVDSQPLQYEAYNLVFSGYGYPIGHDDWRLMVQHSYSIKQWIQEKGIPLDPEKIRDEKKKIYDHFIEEKLQLKPGANNLIELLSGRYRLCIASASRIESIEAITRKFSWVDKFRCFVSDTEVRHGKPFPDVFLKAASQMRTSPSHCVVIEDSAAGLKAAKKAGMTCIVCPDSYFKVSPYEYETADVIVDSLEDIRVETIEGISESI